MSVAGEIVRTWGNPRDVIRGQLEAGHREARLFGYLAIACIANLFGQMPNLYARTVQEPSIGMDARFGGAAFGWLFLAPLFFYMIAALSRLSAKLFGGKGTPQGARLALFWALLAVAPVWFVIGSLSAFINPGLIFSVLAFVALLGFVVIWSLSLYESEFGGESR